MRTTFQPPQKSLTPRDYQFIALVIVVFIGVCVALVFANLTLKGGGDFYVHWVGGRAFLFDKIDPYGGEVPARVQKIVYESAAKAGNEPYILDTPFQILPFYYLFSFLSDPKIARAIFTLILELALFALAILSLRLTEWEAPRIFTVLFIFFAVFNFYTFQAIYEANPVLILGLLYIGILFTYREELDELTGALMALSFYYWEVGLPFLVLVFLRVYYEKRTRVFAGFFMLSFILFFISFLTYPSWIVPFARATVNNLRADFGYNIHTIFAHLWPAQGAILAWIFTGTLVITLGYEWSLARSGDNRRFYWTACLSLAAAPLLGFRTEVEHLSVLIIPLALIFAIIHDRWQRFGNGLIILLMFVIFALPWALYLFLSAVLGQRSFSSFFQFPPSLAYTGFVGGRFVRRAS
ncbi:MAG: hypothetical protein IPL71_14665 [Anaerolineales bacterium]|uniref:hypothetical protein n=1 Tax=Candidatus Villigracilis proximus TaxID=3140683 RepID=UPI0031348C0C|nr:hypothetical protein [Anaerolineales bacterium]